MLSNTLPFGSYDRLETSSWLPLWLQAAGYRTAHLGKFLNGYGDAIPTEVPPGWDEWYATTGRETYRYWGYKVNENGELETYGSDGDPDLYATDFHVAARDRADRGPGRRRRALLPLRRLPRAAHRRTRRAG